MNISFSSKTECKNKREQLYLDREYYKQYYMLIRIDEINSEIKQDRRLLIALV